MLQARKVNKGSPPPPGEPPAAAASPVAGTERRSVERRGVSSLQLDALESERQRIARELHDELGQRLSAAKLVLGGVTQVAGRSTKLIAGLQDLGHMLDDAVDAVRQLARELRPPMLDDLGLNSAIEALATTTANRLGIQIDLQLDADTQVLGSAATIAIYRIVQEALTNVARHAKASHVHIETRLADGVWQLQIDDDGVGIGQREPNGRGSLGLVGMRERAHLLGGRFSIGAVATGGTCVRVELPLHAPDPARPETTALRPTGLTDSTRESDLASHKTELESQNMELRRIQAELGAAHDRYLSLYDYAPVGYLTINDAGFIIEANMTAASLLDTMRGSLIGTHFVKFVSPGDGARWQQHALRSLLSPGLQCVEVMLQPARGMAFHARVDCTHERRGGVETVLRATVSDVSARVQAAMSRRIALRAVDESEAERRRVARALHEDLAQELGALKMDLSRLHQQPSAQHDSSVGHMLGAIDHALTTVRRIAIELRPPMLDDLGLNAAVHWLALDVGARTGVQITVHHDDDDPPLDDARSVGVFRLVQTALGLITRNACGQAATIHLRHSNDELELLLESSGTGWPLADAIKQSITAHSPLVQQAHLLGGRIEVEDSFHQSRRVAFRLPLTPWVSP